MSTATQVDPFALHTFKAVLVDRAGTKRYLTPVSIDLVSLVLESRESVRDAARQLNEKAKTTFESTVQAATLSTMFAVKGLPAQRVNLSDIFTLTVGRAVSRVALCVMKGETVGSITCTGLEVKATEATILLAEPDPQLPPFFKPKRGPTRGTVPPEVWVFRTHSAIATHVDFIASCSSCTCSSMTWRMKKRMQAGFTSSDFVPTSLLESCKEHLLVCR
jgi:hypothetical protein